MEPYVFAHRGASGYEIENTIVSFKKAVTMGAGIESDLTHTKDKKVICFHDPIFSVGKNHYFIQNLTYEEILKIEFEDHRKVPLIEEVFEIFKDISHNLRYSFDIVNKNVGLDLINIAEKKKILDQIEITDRRISVLSYLRNQNQKAKLIYTYNESIKNYSSKTIDFDRLNKINVNIINIRYQRNIENLFKEVIDNNFDCYIWGTNTKINLRKILKFRYKDCFVKAIYTDYPDKLISLIKKHFK
ncbi:MAG: glycerophosphodiester phosphodiesterase [Promethearchaeota archaeon]